MNLQTNQTNREKDILVLMNKTKCKENYIAIFVKCITEIIPQYLWSEI